MKLYEEVKTKAGENDCDNCAFALKCINPCKLNGYHYESAN